MPNTVTSIGDYAFSGCRKLNSVEISNNLTRIGSGAFSYSSLTSITIPSSVTRLGEGVFYACDLLTSIKFNDTTTWYRTTNSRSWENKSGGTLTPLSVPTTNDDYFKSTYSDYYWYKK